MYLFVWPMLGAGLPAVLQDPSAIPVGAAIGMIIATFKLTRRVTQWEDTIRLHSKFLERLPCNQTGLMCPQTKEEE